MRSIYERKAHTELQEEGYLIDWKLRPPRMFRQGTYTPDYFGLFDLLCYKKNNPLRWISIKGTAGVPSAHREEIKAFKLPRNNIKEIWSRSKSRKRDHYWHKEIIE